MRKLSSDYLYYQGLIGLIISPFVLVVLFRLMWVNDLTPTGFLIVYSIIAAFCLFQWTKVIRTRKVTFDGSHLLLATYFIKKGVSIPISDVVYISKVFSLAKNYEAKLYKIKYTYNGKIYKIYFFKSQDLYDITDLANYIGVKNNG